MNEFFSILNVIILVAAAILVLSAYFIVLRSLFATSVARWQQTIETSPWRALLIGLVNLLFFAVLTLVSFSAGDRSGIPVLALPGVFITAALAVALSLGLGAMVEVAAGRLFPTTEGVRRTGLATAMLTLACLTPFVGWFLLLPFVGLIGLGAVIIDWTARLRRSRGR